MPLYMDVHRSLSASAAEVAMAHDLDLKIQTKYGVKYTRYWHDHESQSVYCLVEAPDIHSALRVHKEAHGLMPDDMIEVSPEEVDRFLGAHKQTPSGTDLSDRAFRAIMFTDIEDSTRLTQELGDVEFFRLLQEHDGIVRDQLRQHGGHEIKHTGDGFLAAFNLVSSAVEGSMAIQRAFAARASASPWPIRVRIGLSAGEPVSDHDDLFGAAVQLAARLCSAAEAGQILASRVVCDLCLGDSFEFEEAGVANLKGFSQPIPLLRVAWS